MEEITLTLDPNTKTVTAGLPRTEVDQAQTATAILNFLQEQPAPVEEPAIHDAVEGRKTVKVPALRLLVTEGKVSRTGGGKRGDPYLYAIPSESGSLVPNISREQENQKANSGPSGSFVAENSSSRSPEHGGASPYPVGSNIRFKTGLGFEETGSIKRLTTWTQFPGQPCYQVNGGRTIPHSWVIGLEGTP